MRNLLLKNGVSLIDCTTARGDFGIPRADLHRVLRVEFQVDDAEARERLLEPEIANLRPGLANAKDIGHVAFPLGFDDLAVWFGHADEALAAISLYGRHRLSLPDDTWPQWLVLLAGWCRIVSRGRGAGSWPHQGQLAEARTGAGLMWC